MKKNSSREKMIRTMTAGIFCLFVFGMSAVNLLAEKKDFSANENRVLVPFPSMSAQNILFGDFDTDFEKWFSDHFVGRDSWIRRKASLRIDTGAIENNGVWLARDNRLIQQFLTYDQEIVDNNISYLQEFADDTGMKLNILLVPSAAWGEQQYLPAGAVNINEKELISEIAAALPKQNCIDISDALRQIDDGYFRTDHHWNEKGALIGYQAICQNVLQKDPQQFTFEEVSDDFRGTMYSRSGAFWTPAESIFRIRPAKEMPVQVVFEDGTTMNTLFAESHLEEKDQYPYYLDGNHGYISIHTGAAGGRRAVVIKASYAHILLPYLAQEYAQIDVFDLRYYTDSVSDHISEEERDRTDVYVIYGLPTFCSDSNLSILW